MGNMVGYEAERARLADLTRAAPAGGGGALVIAGEAGSGKSTLCDEATARAAGVTVVATRGTRPDSLLAYAGLYDLVDPLRDLIAELPEPQGRAIRAALAMGDGTAIDALAIAVATLSLFERAAPLLVIVDDAMWLDRSTQAVVGFVARRLGERGVALVATERTEEATAEVLTGVDRVELRGLDLDASVRLLADRMGGIDDAVADQLWRASRGNPLLLIEAADALSPAVLTGREPLPQVLPVGDRIHDLYAARLAVLTPATRRYVLLAAAEDGPGGKAFDELLATQGLGLDDLEPAVSAGLVTLVSGVVAFRHPLIRSAAYYGAQVDERRWAHAALAAATEDPDRRAWHLAEATTGPDDEVARELRDVAHRALGRAGHAEAASALERAASLASAPSARTEYRVAAARSAHASGAPEHGLELLAGALGEAADPQMRAAVVEARCEIELWLGRPRAARDLLVAEADRVAPHAPAWAARLRAHASMPSAMIGDVGAAADLATQAWAVLKDDGDELAAMCTGAAAMAKLLLGERDDGLAMLEAVRGQQSSAEPSFPVVFLLVQCLALAGDLDAAIDTGGRFTEFARQQGTPALLAAPLSVLADVYLRRGRLHAAYAAAQESVQLSRDVKLSSALTHALAMLARVEAVWGREEAITHAREALELVHRTGAEALLPYGNHAIGLAHLSAGRADIAVEYLEEAARIARDHGVRDPSVVPWGPDLVEALVLTGNVDHARLVVAELEECAALVGTRWAWGTVARCRGLLDGTDASTDHFEEALRTLSRDEFPFEAARTELVFGEHLRRARNRRAARQHLRKAVNTFERLGAIPWADRANRELRAAGGASDRGQRPTIAQLSPQQLSIALRVAAGATNREVASALYLSPKTVENRLTDIYAKLGVRSRTELAAYLHRVADV